MSSAAPTPSPGRARWIAIASLRRLFMRPAVLYAGCVAAAAVILAHTNDADFLTYAAAVVRSMGGGSPYAEFQLLGPYPLAQAAGGMGFVYPPTAVPLLVAPALIGPTAFEALGLLAMAAVAGAILRRHLDRRRAALLFLVLLGSPPMLDALEVGQAEPFVAAAFGIAWLSRGAGPVALALAGLLKIYPFAGMLWLVRTGRGLAPSALVSATLIALVTIWLGPAVWRDFLTAYLNGRPTCTAPLPSFSCVLPIHGALAGYLAAATLLLAAWRTSDDRWAFFLVSLASIASAPDLFLRYLLVPMMGALPLLDRLLDSRTVPAVLSARLRAV